MYKLIIGNVRVSVDDSIGREEAAAIARQQVAIAAQQGKLLSHVEIDPGDDGPEIKLTERAGGRLAKKTLKQSMLDGILSAAQEKLYPTHMFANKDTWFDVDTGQEWYGGEVDAAREEMLAKLEAWTKGQ
ncbi:MAG TPA: hypothetical protein PKA10_05375 [Selenomonadales bacterium]|nr:hypothetical protein [Selenomonadales bacterium]